MARWSQEFEYGGLLRPIHSRSKHRWARSPLWSKVHEEDGEEGQGDTYRNSDFFFLKSLSWIKTEINVLTILKATNWSSRVSRIGSFWRAEKKHLFHASLTSWGGCRQSMTLQHNSNLLSSPGRLSLAHLCLYRAFSYLYLFPCLFYKDASYIG